MTVYVLILTCMDNYSNFDVRVEGVFTNAHKANDRLSELLEDITLPYHIIDHKIEEKIVQKTCI